MTVPDPKSAWLTLEQSQNNHLRDFQLLGPSSPGAGGVPVFLAPNSKLLLRHTMSHDSIVNGYIANVTFERSRFLALFTGPSQL